MIGSLTNFAAVPFLTIAGSHGSAKLVYYRSMMRQIDAFEPELQKQSEQDLRRRSLSLRYRAKCGEPLNKLLPEGYALMREACRRLLGLRHYPVQILGGISLHYRSIAEMQTGEGKTLTATLPMYLNALTGRGVLLATSNDYLAKRDAEHLSPVYELLGLKVGTIQSQMSQPARREAYQCDITYGTAKEFGFDFLRDQLLLRRIREGQFDIVGRMLGMSALGGDQPVQREPHFILVDEADSLLIDEARTPLIISALPGEAQHVMVASFQWAAEMVDRFVEEEHYTYDHQKRTIELTTEGRRLARTLPRPEIMGNVSVQSMYEYLERAVRAQRDFHLDQHYIVRDGEIVIVDEYTGRLGEGRKWRDGLHQAIEAKEKLKITVDSGQAARVTVQDYVSRFQHLCGMTGTAVNSAREFRKVFKVGVVVVPTHKPSQRKKLPDKIYGTEEAKWHGIAAEIQEIHSQERPVLVGTRSIDQSERLAKLLNEYGIEHTVLNARNVAIEAEIVSQAGQKDKVTVSTNMAGRGTDIKLGPGVAELGGLHVIVTEMHDSARVDRQLIGRCARQGDPGSFRMFFSLEDELLRQAFGPKRFKRLSQIGQKAAERNRNLSSYRPLFTRAQRKQESRHYRDRKILLYYEKERKKAQIQMGQDPYLDTPY